MVIGQLFPTMVLLTTHATSESTDPWAMILHSNIINFLIAAAILGWLMAKFGLLSWLDAQRKQIEAQLLDAQKKRDDAVAQLQQAEAKLASVNTEIDRIMTEARQTAENMAGNIMTAAQQDADNLLHHVQRRVSLEELKVSRQLEQDMLLAALDEAQRRLAQDMTLDAKIRSIESFIETLPQVVQHTSRGGSN